ncbi:unnamed protein product [Pleuronectes platessa]|uniref:Uncharacterized protein n=1 Tax=Pleuronectes platessa TaxID=8262 RepID=A0A9N7V4K2_PLEPL|nr:unnamed protein product [Pleuronectes platessa]
MSEVLGDFVLNWKKRAETPGVCGLTNNVGRKMAASALLLPFSNVVELLHQDSTDGKWTDLNRRISPASRVAAEASIQASAPLMSVEDLYAAEDSHFEREV